MSSEEGVPHRGRSDSVARADADSWREYVRREIEALLPYLPSYGRITSQPPIRTTPKSHPGAVAQTTSESHARTTRKAASEPPPRTTSETGAETTQKAASETSPETSPEKTEVGTSEVGTGDSQNWAFCPEQSKEFDFVEAANYQDDPGPPPPKAKWGPHCGHSYGTTNTEYVHNAWRYDVLTDV